jgi:hypothetical protein
MLGASAELSATSSMSHDGTVDCLIVSRKRPIVAGL